MSNIKNKFVIFRATFDKQLHDAVMSKDVDAIENILQTTYEEEYNDPEQLFFDKEEKIDIEYCYCEYMKSLDDSLEWA